MRLLSALSAALALSALDVTAAAAQDMSNRRLDSLLRVYVDTLAGGGGQWRFVLGETPMILLTDERYDRMRVVSPVREVEGMSHEELQTCLAANFHSALDVKYALSEGTLWVAFIHPLSPLRDEQFADALAQVRSAVVTYGDTYTSTDLVFPAPRRAAPVAEDEDRDSKRL